MSEVNGEIEKIILGNDVRGIARLQPHLPVGFCKRAADLIISNRPRAMLVTGYYVNGEAETDGPSGTVALADALLLMDYEVVLVTDAVSYEVVQALAPRRAACVEFPAKTHPEARELAAALIELYRPTVIGYIERPGLTADGLYLNMRGVDITPHCGITDYLLDAGIASFAVGDGGNEAGMGRYATQLRSEGINENPSATAADELVAASVSNWGAYGIVAYLSMHRGRDLLPELEIESARIRRIVQMGAVDGFSGKNEVKVDGRPLAESLDLLGRLKDLVDDELGS